MIKVSVIVPIYQAENYIQKCVSSIEKQTYGNIEILLIDDGSTDNSLKICNELGNVDKRIRVMHHENQGVSFTRNRGLREANGEYILFVDADDYIEETMIEYMLQKAEREHAEIVICGFDYIYNDRIEKQTPVANEGKYDKESIYADFWEFYKSGLIHNIGNKLYSKKLLDNNKIFFDESRPVLEDIQFCMDALKATDAVYVCKECFYKYMMQANSHSAQKRYRNGFYLSLQELFEYIHECGVEKSKEFYLVYMDAILLTSRNELYREEKNTRVILEEYKKICDLKYVNEASDHIGCKDVRTTKYIFYVIIWMKKSRILYFLTCIWNLGEK